MHTATLVGDQFILYGGSSEFDEETMQCQEYYGDVHLIGKGRFVFLAVYNSLTVNINNILQCIKI